MVMIVSIFVNSHVTTAFFYSSLCLPDIQSELSEKTETSYNDIETSSFLVVEGSHSLSSELTAVRNKLQGFNPFSVILIL